MTTLNFRRHRRLRSSEGMRSLVRETHLGKHDLIYPIFVVESGQKRKPIRSLPGIYQIPLRILEEEIEEIVQLGIQAVLVFGIPDEKDELGSRAYHDQGIVQDSIRKIKDAFPNLIVIADTCLCEYTSHGHCGVVQGERVLNDPSLDLLARTAVSQALAGADIIAPSNMMDGSVAAIRAGLDKAGFQVIPIIPDFDD